MKNGRKSILQSFGYSNFLFACSSSVVDDQASQRQRGRAEKSRSKCPHDLLLLACAQLPPFFFFVFFLFSFLKNYENRNVMNATRRSFIQEGVSTYGRTAVELAFLLYMIPSAHCNGKQLSVEGYKMYDRSISSAPNCQGIY